MSVIVTDIFNPWFKKHIMKLSKSLLAAIVIGIAVQTTFSSCGKDTDLPKPKKEEVKKEEEKSIPNDCPACGMG